MQPHCETGIYRTIIKVPMPIRIQPIKDFGVNFSCRNTKASTKVIKTLNLSTGTTFDIIKHVINYNEQEVLTYSQRARNAYERQKSSN